jgi:hypothetical protein
VIEFIKFLPEKGGNKKPGKTPGWRRPLGRMVLCAVILYAGNELFFGLADDRFQR